MPVVRDPKDFEQKSGSLFERLVFNHRPIVIIICAILTVFLGFHASKLTINASFEKTIPSSHPYIQNYLSNEKDLRGLGNTVRIVVENTTGDIFDPQYLETLKKINDAVYLMHGVDRSWMKSLWMPIIRWTEVTEEGYSGGPVMPPDYNGSLESVTALRKNVARAGIFGTLVANDLRSSMITVPLLDFDARTGAPLDYRAFSHELEQKIRAEQTPTVKVHIVGFGKLVGDLMDGLGDVAQFFAASAAIATLLIFWYMRCVRSTVLLVSVSLVGVVWLLGLMQLAGYVLDPYSILVPFLIFAIGLSHGAQKMNGIMQDVARGTHKYVAARYTFRRLFLTGLTALLTNVVGFAVLMLIDIPIIKNMALQTSIGVCVLIVTKLILIPVVLSYIGVSKKAAARHVEESQTLNRRKMSGWWGALDRFTERRWAVVAVTVFGAIGAVGFVASLQVRVGDLDPGAPELRKSSRYNQDDAYITGHYGLSSEQFAVIVKTPSNECATWSNLVGMDNLAWSLQQLPGVQAVVSLPEIVRHVTAGQFDGNGKWQTISRDQRVVDAAFSAAQVATPDVTNESCSVTPIVAYLTDHKAATLSRVLDTVVAYGKKYDSNDIQFLPAAGSAGIEAITNVVVQSANRTLLLLLYSAVILLCFITFRSWRAVIVALVPLVITSVLCEALMVALGIGIKVATLPVTALGVGVGVDYALYLLSVQLAFQRSGATLAVAYRKSVMFTGKVVGLIGFTLAAGVVTWAWSPIKFQADMGILLAFMFIWNMLGAVILIPALSHFLLRDPFGNRKTENLSAAGMDQTSVPLSETERSVDRPSKLRVAR
ncbi:efflux RND transporter permease subunit [Paraburkholderia dipogonis]|uniref:efflux RND transporter permease subunit n=1 Tax=Paraburkholderia dipogonis TaxID=1211383 RepID=UPI0038BA5BFC